MTDRNQKLLIVAAVTAAVTVSATALVWTDRVEAARARDAAGPASWTTTAAAVYGREHAVFLDPRSSWASESVGVIATGDTVVTMLGLRNYETSQVDGVTLAGLAVSDGSVRWQAPIAGTAECTDAAVGGNLLCRIRNAETWESTLLTVDVATGATTESATDWSIYAIVADDDATYVLEGDPESDDLRLHKGTPDDPDRSWTTTVDMGTAYESMYESRLLRVVDGAAVLDVGGESAGFDVDTGAQTWRRSLPDCGETLGPSLGGVVTRVREDCGGSQVLSSDLIAADGVVLASTDVAVAHHLEVDRPASADVPILLGDSAYARASGEKLWSSPDLVSAPTNTGIDSSVTLGTAVAVLDDVALLRDYGRQSEGGLDLRTGERLWDRTAASGLQVAAALGTVAVSLPGDALVGTDIRTGEEVWRIALDAFDSEDDPFSISSGAIGQAGDRVLFATGSLLGGFRP